MSGFLTVKNFEIHQHYRDRRPPWIKFHAALLDDYDFTRLQDASKAHLVLIWLLASKLDNRIPNDPEWIAKQIGATAPLDLQGLVAKGFLIEAQGPASNPLAERKQNAIAETERETEAETDSSAKIGKGPAKYSDQFAEFWAAYPRRAGGDSKHDAWLQYQARLRSGESATEMLAGAKRYAVYCRETGKLGTEFVKQGRTFLGKARHYLEKWEVPPPVVPKSKFAPPEGPPRPRVPYRADDGPVKRDPQRLGELMGTFKELAQPGAKLPRREA